MRNKSLPAVIIFLCVSVGVKAETVLIQSPGVVKVREGGTVQIQCVLESDNVDHTVDKYDVHWYNSHNKLTDEEIVLSLYRDGRVYRSRGFSDRFQLSRNVTTNCYSLTISNVKITDSKLYICAIWGMVFGNGTQLNVTSADVPVLIQSPSIQRVTEGHTAWLWCTMRNARLEDTDVHWYRKLPGQDMEWVLTHRARGSPEWGRGFTERFQSYRDTSNSSFTLTVTDVVHSDSAVYYCRVWGDIDGNGTQLIVTNPADDPVLMQDPPISKVPEGVTVQLHCALYNASVTVTDVHWYHQRPGNKIEWTLSHFVNDSVSRSGYISDRFQSYRNVVSNSYILTISNTSISDTAVYNCRVWSYIYGGGTQLNVTEMSRVPSYLAWLILAVLLGVLAVTGGIFLIRRRAFGDHPSHPPTATDHRSPEADYENVSVARDVPGSGGHQVDSNNTYMALQRPTQSIYGRLQADNKPPSTS